VVILKCLNEKHENWKKRLSSTMTSLVDILWKVVGPIFLLILGLVSWVYKTKLKEIEKDFRSVHHDIEILQDRFIDIDRKAIADSTTIVSLKSDMLRLEREVGKVEGSLSKLHTRIDELKDLIYEKMK